MKKIIFLLMATFHIGIVCAQEATDFDLTIDHVALSVKNLDVSVAFYTQTLHLHEITNKTKKEGIRWVSLGDAKELHLVSTIKEPVIVNKAVHIAFKTTHFEALVAMLDNNHIPYLDWAGTLHKITIRADGIRQLYFQDPDGYWIEVNSAE